MHPHNLTDVFSIFTNGIRLAIKAKPGISHARAAKIVDVGDGKRAVEIAIAAAPEDGKANKAIIATLAKQLGLPKADISIKTGTTGRMKVIEIAGDTDRLRTKLVHWLDGME